jgi:ABC-type transport system involved in multi-copper enzyme maturation permease subunit
VTRLLRAELRRFLARDVVRMFVVAVLIAIAIGATITAVNSKMKPPNEAAYRSELQHCLNGDYVSPDKFPNRNYDTLEEYCDANVRPEYFGGGDQRFDLSGLPNILQGAGILVVIGGLLLGASFVGAEWHAGTMTTLLTWEPRRLRVLAAKTIVTAVCVFVLMTLLLAVFALALTLVASTRGITDDLGDHFVRSVAGSALRVAASASAGALVGSAIAMLTRSTAAAVAVGFAYLALIEGFIRALRPGWQHYLLADNIAVVVTGGDSGIMREPVTFASAVVAVVVWTAVLTGAAAVAFRARDVN